MPFLSQILFVTPIILAVVRGQGVITNAQGTTGSPASKGFQVLTAQTDANIINQNEISSNIVNECGRTLLNGNIDIGTVTEDALANKSITSVTKGSTVDITINQVSADGAGPYNCDLDLTSNADGVSGQTNLTVTEKDAASATGDITLTITMPTDLACIGASTGNVCTVRCRNSAVAGPFGGCFAVQQTDVTPNQNSAETIATAQTLGGINSQIAENILALPAAIKANADSSLAEQGLNVANALLSSTAPPAAAAATSITTAVSGQKGSSGKKSARAFIS